jgi:hypothetical protein
VPIRRPITSEPSDHTTRASPVSVFVATRASATVLETMNDEPIRSPPALISWPLMLSRVPSASEYSRSDTTVR